MNNTMVNVTIGYCADGKDVGISFMAYAVCLLTKGHSESFYTAASINGTDGESIEARYDCKIIISRKCCNETAIPVTDYFKCCKPRPNAFKRGDRSLAANYTSSI
jgi:hypothetical protein